MRYIILIGCLLWGMLFGGMASAQSIDESCTQDGQSACVDWNKGIVISEGIGAPSSTATNSAVRNASAIRAARLDAARNIMEMIKGINISSTTTVQDAMVTNDTIRTRIQGRLHGLRPIGAPRYFSDGTVKVRMEAQLHRTIPQELLYRQNAQPPPSAKSSSKVSSQSQIDVNRVYTGLIIDAKKTGVQPAMSPKVFDEQGKEVYGSAYVDRDFVLKHGMAGYVKDVAKAKQNDRIKQSPLVIKAIRTAGSNATDLVISDGDAKKIKEIAANQNFLREARVMIVLD